MLDIIWVIILSLLGVAGILLITLGLILLIIYGKHVIHKAIRDFNLNDHMDDFKDNGFDGGLDPDKLESSLKGGNFDEKA